MVDFVCDSTFSLELQSFIVDTKGWYCVTKGNISFSSSLLFCFGSAAFLSVSFTSDSNFSSSSKIVWLASVHQARFEIRSTSSNVASEEFVRRILKASPLTDPL